MNDKKSNIRTEGELTRETKRFPVIEISREELFLFFDKELVNRLTDDDMSKIADRYGDRLWNPDSVDDLRDIVAETIAKNEFATGSTKP